MSLDDCYRLAVENSEQLAISLEDYLQAVQERWVAWSSSLASVSAKGRYFRQKKISVGGLGTLSPPRSKDFYFRLEQPVFTGFRNLNTIRKSGDTIDAQKAEAQDARNQVFLAVAEAFYAILQAEHEAGAVSASLKVQQERHRQVQALIKAGVARRSELLLIESNLANDRARLARAEQNVVTNRDRLSFLVGVRVEQALGSEEDLQVPPEDLPGLIARGLTRRPDIQKLRHEMEAEEKEVHIAKGAFGPEVSLVADHYAHREGFRKEVDWEVGVAAELSLFEGGRRLAELRQARSRLRQARLRLRERERQAELEIRQTHAELKTSRSLLDAHRAQLQAAEEAHRLVTLEYKNGVATNLEVLAAQNALLDAQVQLENERLNRGVLVLRLRVALGEAPVVRGQRSVINNQ